MDLTGKQKRYLKGLGQKLPDFCTVGKDGLTKPIIYNIQKQFDKTELVKVRLRFEEGSERQQTAALLEKETDSTCVAVVGKTILLYRVNEKLKDEKKIKLPK